MVKFPRIVMFLALPALALGHFITEEWDAHIGDSACYVAIKSGVDFMVSESTSASHDIDLNVIFFTPNDKSERHLPQLPSVMADPVILQVQFLPSMLIREDLGAISEVYVLFGEEEVPLVRDPTIGDDTLPGYVQGGSEVAAAWESLQAGVSLTVAFRVEGSEKLTVDIPTGQFRVAAAMFNACVEEFHSNGGK